MKKLCTLVLFVVLLSPLFAFPQNHTGIVIQNSNGDVMTRCGEFIEESLPVDQLLLRSGFKLVTSESGFGTSICFLHDDGIEDPDNCFGHPLGWFWNFFVHNGSEWVSSEVGVSSANATEGSLVGFAFGGFNEVTLPPLTFDDVCGYTSTAAIVVDHSNGDRRIQLVSFPGETVSAFQLLEQSRLELVTVETSFGIGICSIDGEGQSSNDCFNDPLGRFWNFNLLQKDDTWIFSSVGVGESIVRAGDILGFFFASSGDQPPISREEVFTTSNVNHWEQMSNLP